MSDEPSSATDDASVASIATTAPGSRLARNPWRVLFPALLILFLVLRTAAPLRDQDSFWHIASGRDLLERWQFSGPDPFTPFTGGPWIRHAWLPDIIFALADRAGGPRAVALLLPVMTAIALVVIYVALRHRGAQVLLSSVLLGLTFIGMSGSLAARPQVLTFAFTAAITALWLAAAERGRQPWLVVPLTWLWASSHGLWLLSPLIGGTVTLGILFQTRDLRMALRSAVVVVATAAVGAITPVGPRLLRAPFQVGEVTSYIQEWQPPSPTSGPVLAALTLGVAGLLCWASRGRVGTWPEILLLMACVPLMMTARRTVGVAAVLAAVVAARALSEALPLPAERWRRSETAAVIAGALLGVGAAAAVLATAPATVGFPTGLDARLSALPPTSVVCHDYEAGSWLLWAHPSLVPIIDGRLELYTATQIQEQEAFQQAQAGWQDVPSSRGCTVALVRATTPIDIALSRDPLWSDSGGDDDTGWRLYESR